MTRSFRLLSKSGRARIHIGLQHDNPHTHFGSDDPMFVEAATQHPRIKFHIQDQPANSPDTNVLDLGFFRALQTAFWKLKRARNIDGLITNVEKAWQEYPPEKINRVWLSHQAVLEEIIVHEGTNDYNLPHIGKDQLEKHGELPHRLQASHRAIEIARNYLEI